MRTEQEVNAAREKLHKRVQTPGLNDMQRSHLVGMLNAIVWVAGGEHTSTFERVLSDEPIAAGKDPQRALDRIKPVETHQSAAPCPACGTLMWINGLRGMFCPKCE